MFKKGDIKMTKYSDFDIKIKKTSGENKETRTTISPITTISIKYCDPTNGSCGTGCCNSKRNCPGSTGRRKY